MTVDDSEPLCREPSDDEACDDCNIGALEDWNGMPSSEEMGAPELVEAPDAARMLVDAYGAERGGRKPPLPWAELTLAQIWFENGGTKDSPARFYHGNVGNISCDDESGVPFYRPPWWDPAPDAPARLLRLHDCMKYGHDANGKPCSAPKAFHAFPGGVAEGMRYYVHFVMQRGYAPMVRTAESGDAEAFAEAIRTTRYCPDCPMSLGATLAGLRDGFRRAKVFDPFSLPPGSSSSGGDLTGLAVTAALFFGPELLEAGRRFFR